MVDPSGHPMSPPTLSPADQRKQDALWRRIEAITGTGDGTTANGRVIRCGRCRRVCIRGLDAAVAARDVRLDPSPLSVLGEAVAVVTGRESWSVTLRAQTRLEINPRYSWEIAARPAGELESGDVLTRHVCASPWPSDGPLTGPTRIPARARSDAGTGDPPF